MARIKDAEKSGWHREKEAKLGKVFLQRCQDANDMQKCLSCKRPRCVFDTKEEAKRSEPVGAAGAAAKVGAGVRKVRQDAGTNGKDAVQEMPGCGQRGKADGIPSPVPARRSSLQLREDGDGLPVLSVSGRMHFGPG